MQAGVGLLVSDVMPIYMIIPRYSHNYAQFCQLLNSNLFTHRRILMLLREATSETYGPRVYSHHINLYHFICWFVFYFAFYFSLCIYLWKIPKILFIISIRSHPCKWWWRDWQPLIAVVASSYRLCRYEGLERDLLLDWYLGSQKLREILTLLCCITLSSSRENQRMLKR